MIETKGPFTVLGPSFGGTALEVKVADLDKFFEKNRINFTEAGFRSLMRTMGIPATFFNDQEKDLQAEIFLAQQQKLQEKQDKVYILRDMEGILVFCSHATDSGYKDPFDKLGSTIGWRDLRRDYDRGYVRMSFSPNLTVENEFRAALLLNFPIFYVKPVIIELGMLKPLGELTAVDRANGGFVEIKPKEYSEEKFLEVFSAFKSMVVDFGPGYVSAVEGLEDEPSDYEGTKDVCRAFLVSKKIPKTLVNKVLRHVDLLIAGKEVDEGTPTKITNCLEGMEVFLNYSKQLTSLLGQDQSEAAVFEAYWQKLSEKHKKLNYSAVRARVNMSKKKIESVEKLLEESL